MPLDMTIPERVADLNTRYRHQGATQVLEHALDDPMVGQLALVSSFGAESVVLLHLISVMAPTTPVIFLDTELLFPETLAYQEDLAERLKLSDVRRIQPDRMEVFAEDNENLLHQSDPDSCCNLRKTRPLARALDGFDTWITGRKRFQGGQRTLLDFFEMDPNAPRIKVNPLVHWERDNVAEYILNNRLPRHPLISKGFQSIGCAPCTSAVKEGEDPRAGRWRNHQKIECGIHFGTDGPLERTLGFASATEGVPR